MSLTTGGGGSSLMPTNMDQAARLATAMASAKMVPDHLQGSPGDCLMVIEQAMRWSMSPFAVAQCTSVIHGRLMFEGKLVAAAVQASGILATRFRYTYAGAGDERACTVIATISGETEPRDVTVVLRDVRTKAKDGSINKQWTGGQIDQQLSYAGVRAWARRHTPEVMLGVYAPEEFDAQPARAPDTFTGPTIDARAEPAGTRKAINEAVPLTPKKPTITEWLDALEADLAAAADAAAVDAIIARPDVQKAEGAFQNGARDRLNAMVKAALDRTSLAKDATFLGEDERMET